MQKADTRTHTHTHVHTHTHTYTHTDTHMYTHTLDCLILCRIKKEREKQHISVVRMFVVIVEGDCMSVLFTWVEFSWTCSQVHSRGDDRRRGVHEIKWELLVGIQNQVCRCDRAAANINLFFRDRKGVG